MTVIAATPRVRESSVRVNRVRLAYSDWPGDASCPVLLVHGLNSQRHMWDPLAVRLSGAHRVITVDLRGHGDSGWARDGYHLRSFVEDLRSFSERLELGRFSLVGHSLGARVGIAYGGEHGDTLRSLVLSDAGPEVSRGGAEEVKTRQAGNLTARGFSSEEKALGYVQELHPTWQPAFHRLYVSHQYRRNWAGVLVQKGDPDLFWMTGRIGLRDVPNLWEMAARIPVPTLVMWGRTSTILDEVIVKRMLATIPRGELAVFESGHYIPREKPEEFAEVVAEFLSREPELCEGS